MAPTSRACLTVFAAISMLATGGPAVQAYTPLVPPEKTEGEPTDMAPTGENLDPETPGLDTTGTPPLPRAGELPPASAAPGEDRPVPDYDGREDEPASAGDVLVWVPRVIFFPVYVTLEYVVRWPLVKLITLMEEHYVIQHVVDFFTWSEGKAGVFPTAFFELGISPSIGFYAYYEDVFGAGSKQVLHGGFWDDKQQLALENRMSVFRDDSGTISLNAIFSNRPDFPFYGVGYHTTEGGRADYNEVRVEGELGLLATIQDLNRARFSARYRFVDHSGGSGEDEESIEDAFDVTDPEVVPGWGDYHLVTFELKLELDSRSPHRDFTSGSGVRLDWITSFSIDPVNPDLHFLIWGGELSGFVDLTGINHVVGLRLYTAFLEQTGDDPVPFTEQIIMGGAEHMRAFLNGRFRGESAVVITADYRYPIWAYLDGELFIGLGNTFDHHLEGFAWDRLFLNWGIGFRSNTSRDVSFDFLVAFGSNRLDADSFEIDRVGIVVGVNQGF